MSELLHAACLQTAPAWEDVGANLADVRERSALLPSGTDLAVLPEMFASGFTMRPACLGPAAGARARALLADLARGCGSAFAGSLVDVVDDVAGVPRYVNRFALARPDGSAVLYDKRHRFALAGEREAYAPGSARPVVAELRGWRILLQICYDLRFPVFSRNAGADPYDLALYVANWPASRRAHWTALLRARAIENQAYVIGVNRVGTDGAGVAYAGDTCAFGPLGETLLDAGDEAGWHSVTLARETLRDVRERLPFLADRDAFSLRG